VRSGLVRCGGVGSGCQWHIYKSRVTAWWGRVRQGWVWYGRVWCGKVWVPMAHFTKQNRWRVWPGVARSGQVRHGAVRCG
jgi:hypothetical protein